MVPIRGDQSRPCQIHSLLAGSACKSYRFGRTWEQTPKRGRIFFMNDPNTYLRYPTLAGERWYQKRSFWCAHLVSLKLNLIHCSVREDSSLQLSSVKIVAIFAHTLVEPSQEKCFDPCLILCRLVLLLAEASFFKISIPNLVRENATGFPCA